MNFKPLTPAQRVARDAATANVRAGLEVALEALEMLPAPDASDDAYDAGWGAAYHASIDSIRAAIAAL